MRYLIISLIVTVTTSFVQAENVENPSFRIWKAFGLGTKVTTITKQKSEASDQTSVVTMIDEITLADMSENQVTIETRSSAELNGKTLTGPPQKQVIPRFIDKTKFDKDFGAINNAPGEKITVPAGTFTCHKIEIHDTSDLGKFDGVVWWSSDVPGGGVKVLSTSSQTRTLNGKPTVITTSRVTEMSSIEKK